MLRLMESTDVRNGDSVESLHSALKDGKMGLDYEPCRGLALGVLRQDAKSQRMPQRGMLP